MTIKLKASTESNVQNSMSKTEIIPETRAQIQYETHKIV